MSLFKKYMMLTGLIVTLLTSAFATVPVYADTASATTLTAAQAQVFTIDKAIEYAKENSLAVISCKTNEEHQNSLQSEARVTHTNTKKTVNRVGLSDVNTYLVADGYMYRAAQFNYRVAQRATLQTLYSLECSVSQAFYNYLSCINKENYAAENLNLAKNNYSYAQIRFNGGMISENDLISFRNAELEAQYALNQATRNKEYSMMNLKYTLNYPQDSELTIIGEFKRISVSSVTPEQAVEKAKNSITRANAEESFAFAKEKLEKYHRFYMSTQPAWHSAAAEFSNAELTYKKTLDEEYLGIHNAYNNMITAYEQLDYLEKTLEFTEKSLMAAKLNYELGTITASDYLSANQSYANLKNTLADAELGAYMALTNYEMTFDCVNTIFEEEDSKP